MNQTRRGLSAGLLALMLAAPGARAEEPVTAFQRLPVPSLNFYGVPGLIDMPSAEMLPDGQFATSVSWFAGQTRLNVTFQAFPWLSASFRYNGIRDYNLDGFQTYYDRGFDLRVRLLKETARRPALTLGLQDFAGTGIYAGEYIVATKTLTLPGRAGARPGRLKLTGGIGWGRLGSNGSFGSPFGSTRPVFTPGDTGGELATDQWFRGPAAFFGGIEWQPNDRWGLKLEYSSDGYALETGRTSVFQRDSSINLGVEYQWSDRTRIGAYYLYGSEFGITAQIQLNPRAPVTRLNAPAPQPVARRPADPLAWSEDWVQSAAAPVALRDTVTAALAADGLALEYLVLRADLAELRFRNTRYYSEPIAIGRAARVLARHLPASVETFRLVPMKGGLAASATTLRRSDLEALEFDPDAAAALRTVSGIGEAAPLPGAGALASTTLYPNFRWFVGPYFEPSYFDPDQPLRLDFGVQLRATYEPAPGWVIGAEIRHRLAGNVDGGRVTASALEPVRTGQVDYAQFDTGLRQLYAARQWKPAPDLYARVTVGYLEQMFGGISAELLWKPVQSNLGFGIEANYVRQRDFNQRFGFRDYTIATGHASAYYEFGRGYLGRVDVGRYLAGDVGATVDLSRTFANGWQVGGWFTLTNVSAEDFGEGSFDKGIYFRIPINWFLGTPSQSYVGTAIRPIQRDGGQRLEVPGRLYNQVRQSHMRALDAQWVRIWE